MRNEELGMRNEDAETVVKKRRGRKRTRPLPDPDFTPTGRPRKKKVEPVGQTRIVWSDAEGELVCERCGKIIQYNFGFRVCPYCGAKVIETQARRATPRMGVTACKSAVVVMMNAGAKVVVK